jgi:hypothetical protein
LDLLAAFGIQDAEKSTRVTITSGVSEATIVSLELMLVDADPSLVQRSYEVTVTEVPA